MNIVIRSSKQRLLLSVAAAAVTLLPVQALAAIQTDPSQSTAGAAPGTPATPNPADPTSSPTIPTSGSADTSINNDDQTAETADDIVVTGTLFRRANTETPSPVTSLSAENLSQRGITTIADAVQTISAGNGGSVPQNFNSGFAAGAVGVSLRGLSTNSTLTLFDGMRAAYYPQADDGQRSFVDLNVIPSAIVERVEVLKDGASSTYGADAIGGVVNVILKKEIKGLQGRVEAGIAQRGDSENQRAQLTYGYGDLSDQGFNFYLSGEYQHVGSVFNRDRGFPYNTNNLSRIRLANGQQGANGNFGFSPYSPSTTGGTIAAVVRPATLSQAGNVLTGTAVAGGLFRPIQQGGCAGQGLTANTTAAAGTYCEQDIVNNYGLIQPLQTRFGGTAHATANIGDDAQAYFVATFYQSKVQISGTPQSIRSINPAITTGIALPARLSNGQLNPQNPFAAQNQAALIYYRFGDIAAGTQNVNRSYRAAAGIDGKFGDGWGYSAAATYMRSDLDIERRGLLYLPNLISAINNGTYNFVDPSANSQAVRDSIGQTLTTRSNSELWQMQAVVTRDLFDLPGGPLQLGVGGQIRYEKLNNPTAVPNNDFITVNPVSAVGDQYVSAAFFELNAPVLDTLEVNASGRYDHYSTGFGRFSPKIGAKFTPFRQLAIRGTYSQGFRAPSIPETSGQVIGFTNYTPGGTLSADQRATLYARYGNSAYITSLYGLGNNSVGNPDLDPEKSRSFTGGVVVQPTRFLSLTVDYYNIKKTNLVVSTAGGVGSIADNYLLTGALPDGVGITGNVPDPSNPTLRPTPLSVNFLYGNATSLKTDGIDAQVQLNFPLAEDTRFTSIFEGTYVNRFNVNDGTGILRYAGTLGSYNSSSASGTPRYRANWQNTLDAGPWSLTATAYYVSGYKGYADDYSGAGSSCDDAVERAVTYNPNNVATPGDPLQCRVKDWFQLDLVSTFRVNDNFTFYVNVVNLLDDKAPFDPNTYGGNNYNPAWSSGGVIGRLFRAGATFKF
ncbi:TonB-dependent receptor [Sphingomonas cynarae]|uniref:TonB-dependent receptor n=1 Tax=Sphingomonas cynarae TaxID=930197 RepID=A0ABP7EV38_9SPHN